MEWTIKNVFYRFCFPVRLYLDTSSMTSGEAREVTKRFGIQLGLIAPHNHKGLGPGERQHAPLVGALNRYTRDNPRNWPEKLELAAFADRVTTNVRGDSPYNVIFGQDPLLHVDFAKESFVLVNFRDGMSEVELLAARMRQAERRFSDLIEYRRRLELDRQKGADYYNEKHKHQFRKEPLKVGDAVLLFDSNRHDQWHRKITDVWIGPYVVVEIRSGGTYQLRELNGRLMKRVVSSDQLKRWKLPTVFKADTLFFDDDLKKPVKLEGKDLQIYNCLASNSYADQFPRCFSKDVSKDFEVQLAIVRKLDAVCQQVFSCIEGDANRSR